MLLLGCGSSADESATQAAAGAAGAAATGEAAAGAQLVDEARPSWSQADSPAPHLVLSVVIEGLGSDTLTRLLPALSEDGFIRRAMADGAYYPRATLPYASTYSAPGYATLYTGATPRHTGVVADALRAETVGETVGPYDLDGTDLLVPGTAPEEVAPSNPSERIRTRTVADTLRVSTGGTAKIASVGLRVEGVWPGAGHGRAAAYFHNVQAGRYQALRGRRSAGAREPTHDAHLGTARYLRPWTAHDPAHLAQFADSDLAEGELDWLGRGVVFPHDITAPRRASRDARRLLPARAFHATPSSTESVLALAARLMQEEHMAADDIPDLIAIGVRATGESGRYFGTHSWEYLSNVIAADLLLAELVDMLMERGPVAVLLTSDHGLADLPERHRDGQRIDPTTLRRDLDNGMDELLSRRINWVETIVPPYVYLTRGAPFRMDEAVTAAIRYLETRPEVLRAYAVDEVPRASEGPDQVDNLVRESLFPGVGGEVYVVLREGAVWDTMPPLGAGTQPGGISATERTVPILMVGAGVRAGATEAEVDIRRYAPSLSALLHAPRPSHSRLPPLGAVRR